MECPASGRQLKDYIEDVLIHYADIGAIFNQKLRDVYDYIFEEGQAL